MSYIVEVDGKKKRFADAGKAWNYIESTFPGAVLVSGGIGPGQGMSALYDLANMDGGCTISVDGESIGKVEAK